MEQAIEMHESGSVSVGEGQNIALSASCSVARVLASHYGQREMLSMILEVMERELGMSRGTILLLSSDGSELIVEAVSDLATPEQQAVRYQRGEGIVGQVLQTGEPTIIPRISDEPRFCDRIYRRRDSGKCLSFICVPITLGSEVIGTLSADLPCCEARLLEEKRQVLTVVSSMIASDVKRRWEAQRERQALEEENLRLRSELGGHFRPENILGNSHTMRQVYQRIRQVAQADTTVLVRGESGTGKELVASAIHYGSKRANRPLVKINCAALSETLIESELFGHEKGAFTGALRDRVGRIEEAEGGTLFLDEVGDFSPAVQIKLLRVIQERQYERVGSNVTQNANVRFITATNRDLEGAVEAGLFRQDLYYRINVFGIQLPPLRDRKEDILLLADYFVHRYAQKMSKSVSRISTTAINMMMAYHWPGNVRELENCVEHAVVLSTDGVIHGHNLPPTLQMPLAPEGSQPGSLRCAIDIMERDMIVDALKRCGGNYSAVARELEITPRMVRYKIQKLKISPALFKTTLRNGHRD
jgi:Nif-specific regulatory protein